MIDLTHWNTEGKRRAKAREQEIVDYANRQNARHQRFIKRAKKLREKSRGRWATE